MLIQYAIDDDDDGYQIFMVWIALNWLSVICDDGLESFLQQKNKLLQWNAPASSSFEVNVWAASLRVETVNVVSWILSKCM